MINVPSCSCTKSSYYLLLNQSKVGMNIALLIFCMLMVKMHIVNKEDVSWDYLYAVLYFYAIRSSFKDHMFGFYNWNSSPKSWRIIRTWNRQLTHLLKRFMELLLNICFNLVFDWVYSIVPGNYRICLQDSGWMFCKKNTNSLTVFFWKHLKRVSSKNQWLFSLFVL